MRGLYCCRRPQKPADSMYCPQPVVWKQWLVQLAVEGQPLDPKPFDHPPTDPPGVTWGQKPGSSSSNGGRHLHAQPWQRRTAAAAADASSSTNSSSSSGWGQMPSSSSNGGRPLHAPSWRRRTAATTADISSSTDISSSRGGGGVGMKPHGRYSRLRFGVRRRYKQHTRPAFGSTTGSTSQQAEAVGFVLPAAAAAAAPLPSDLPPGRGSSSNSGSSSSSSEDAGWQSLWGQPPVALAIADAKAVYGQQHSINEKNWMPFVWQVGRKHLTASCW
jgi:hypothetical protein